MTIVAGGIWPRWTVAMFDDLGTSDHFDIVLVRVHTLSLVKACARLMAILASVVGLALIPVVGGFGHSCYLSRFGNSGMVVPVFAAGWLANMYVLDKNQAVAVASAGVARHLNPTFTI